MPAPLANKWTVHAGAIMQPIGRLPLEGNRTAWILILASVVFISLLAPSPLALPLLQANEAMRDAAARGSTSTALAKLEAILSFEPALAAWHLRAAEWALDVWDAPRAAKHLEALRPVSSAADELDCLQRRAQVQVGSLETLSRQWVDPPANCRALADDLRLRLSRELSFDTAERLLPAYAWLAEQLPQDEEIARTHAYLLAALDPDSAAPYLRSLSAAASPASKLALGLLLLSTEPAASARRFALIGQAFGRAGEWSFAAIAFDQALRHGAGRPLDLAYLGLALDQSERNGESDLRAAVQAAPTSGLPRVFLALHWLQHGEDARALRELQIAARLAPENPAVAAQIGAAYSRLGDIPAAESAFRLAAQLAPDEPEFWLLLARFAVQHELKLRTLAMPAARNAAMHLEDPAPALDLLGYAYLLEGDLDLAERLLYRSIMGDPRRSETQYHIGLLRELQGDRSRALAAFRAAARLAPKSEVGALAKRSIARLER